MAPPANPMSSPARSETSSSNSPLEGRSITSSQNRRSMGGHFEGSESSRASKLSLTCSSISDNERSRSFLRAVLNPRLSEIGESVERRSRARNRRSLPHSDQSAPSTPMGIPHSNIVMVMLPPAAPAGARYKSPEFFNAFAAGALMAALCGVAAWGFASRS